MKQIIKLKKPKILLFFPSPLPYERNWHGVPLALLAISRVLDKQNYQINIYARHLQTDYQKILLADGQDAICLGISAMTGFQINDGLKIAKLFKKKYPHIPIIWVAGIRQSFLCKLSKIIMLILSSGEPEI